ncbi:hypothetical protein Tco_1540818 [Tanacetum coccineum]
MSQTLLFPPPPPLQLVVLLFRFPYCLPRKLHSVLLDDFVRQIVEEEASDEGSNKNEKEAKQSVEEEEEEREGVIKPSSTCQVQITRRAQRVMPPPNEIGMERLIIRRLWVHDAMSIDKVSSLRQSPFSLRHVGVFPSDLSLGNTRWGSFVRDSFPSHNPQRRGGSHTFFSQGTSATVAHFSPAVSLGKSFN